MKRVALLLVVLATTLGCSREHRYESVVQVIRKEAVEKSADGKTDQLDFELEWDACPGDQFQVVRGSKEFAACADKYAVGDYVPVVVRHFWDERGYYRWDIEKLGDCAHVVEPNAEGSYEKSQACKDVVQQGRVVGFDCSRRASKGLVKRCPWLARE